jgi:methionine-rich copper-binding protein CopC
MRNLQLRFARRLRTIASLALAIAIATAAGTAHAMEMIESTPKVNEIMEGKATAFAVRFDQPVSHRSSRLILVTPEGNRTLPLRLRTEPDTLYANVGPLPSGKYELQWEARAADGTISKGSIPFTVEAK